MNLSLINPSNQLKNNGKLIVISTPPKASRSTEDLCNDFLSGNHQRYLEDGVTIHQTVTSAVVRSSQSSQESHYSPYDRTNMPDCYASERKTAQHHAHPDAVNVLHRLAGKQPAAPNSAMLTLYSLLCQDLQASNTNIVEMQATRGFQGRQVYSRRSRFQLLQQRCKIFGRTSSISTP